MGRQHPSSRPDCAESAAAAATATATAAVPLPLLQLLLNEPRALHHGRDRGQWWWCVSVRNSEFNVREIRGVSQIQELCIIEICGTV